RPIRCKLRRSMLSASCIDGTQNSGKVRRGLSLLRYEASSATSQHERSASVHSGLSLGAGSHDSVSVLLIRSVSSLAEDSSAATNLRTAGRNAGLHNGGCC